MPHGKPRDLDKERLWAARIQLWHKSGLSARLFCLRHNLSLPSFYAWRRTLQLRHKPAPATPDQPAFFPVHVRQEAQPPHSLELILPSGYRLLIPQGYDTDHLADILDTLEVQPC